jgi:two-component sensor histidine kinase
LVHFLGHVADGIDDLPVQVSEETISKGIGPIKTLVVSRPLISIASSVLRQSSRPRSGGLDLIALVLTLAVIQGIAGQTIRSVEKLADFKTRFTQRLQGIAATQDILVRQDWTGGDLRQLVTTQLELFDLGEGRITLSGPEVTLSADAVQSVGLALHELATNALKYGALSATTGQVRVAWYSEPDGKMLLTWIEQGGPPVVAPLRTGFGSTVLDRMAASSVDGVVELDYAKSGLRWRLAIPSKHITVRSE